MRKARIQSYLAVFAQEEDGGYSVSVPALPGCFSQGDTFEDAQKNIRAAIRLYVKDTRADEQRFLRSPRQEIVAPVTV